MAMARIVHMNRSTACHAESQAIANGGNVEQAGGRHRLGKKNPDHMKYAHM